MFGRSVARGADVARARLRALGHGWVPTQHDVDAAFGESPRPLTAAPVCPPGAWADDPPADRYRLRPEAARALVVLAVVGVVAAVTVVLLGWPRGEPVPAEVRPLVVAGASSTAAVDSANAFGGMASAGAASGVVVVDVAGEVHRPGVRELPVGSRVIDAIEAAGGLTRRADTTALNLARVLADGEQVLVAGGSAAASTTGGSSPPSSPGGSASLVNVNTASLEQLDALPGIGPVLAQAIIDYRTQNGSFASLDQLLDVSGIGDATFADLQGLVTL